MKLVAIDIGNSSIDIGFFIEAELFVQKINTKPPLQPSEYSELFTGFMREKNIDKMPEGIIISSVAPGIQIPLKRLAAL